MRRGQFLCLALSLTLCLLPEGSSAQENNKPRESTNERDLPNLQPPIGVQNETDRSAMSEILGIVAKEVGKKFIGGGNGGGGGPLGGLTGGGGSGGGFRETLTNIAQNIVSQANREQAGFGGQRPPLGPGPGYGNGPRPNQYQSEGERNPPSGILSGGPLSRPNSQNSLFQGSQNSGFGGGQRPPSLVGGTQYEREPMLSSHGSREPYSSHNHSGGRKPYREEQGMDNGPWRRENKPDFRDTIIRE